MTKREAREEMMGKGVRSAMLATLVTGMLCWPGLAEAQARENPYFIQHSGNAWQLSMRCHGQREAVFIRPQGNGWQISGVMRQAPIQLNLERHRGGAEIAGSLFGLHNFKMNTNNNFLNLLIRTPQPGPLFTSLRARPAFAGIRLTGPLLGKNLVDVKIGHSSAGLLIDGVVNQSRKLNMVVPTSETIRDNELKLIFSILILASDNVHPPTALGDQPD